MDRYHVTGMSCAACSARVEKAVSAVEGVTECSVSLLTNSMAVEGTADPSAVISAVEKAGYGASRADDKSSPSAASSAASPEDDPLFASDVPVLKKRLILSVGFLAVLMYLSMGHLMGGWPVPPFLEDHAALAVMEMLLAIVVMIINQKFFTGGFGALFRGAPNMDTLVAMGSSASFGYSLAELFLLLSAHAAGDTQTVMYYVHHLYFESAAMIPALITVGKLLEAISKGRTTDALKSLMRLAPKSAVLERDGQEVTVPIGEVRPGDVFVVRPGENLPVDGVVIDGVSAVNEAILTGESIPVDKAEGDPVSAATANQSGFLRCRAQRVGEDTTLAQIIRMVSDASATKAPIARIADKVSGIFVPTVLGIAAFVLVVWLIAGKPFDFAIARSIAVMVISCPCALGLATPVAIMVANGVGAGNGILFKTASALENMGKSEIAALDKTGTITEGHPEVTDIVPADGITEEELLSFAAALEKPSEHPLAEAVTAAAEGRGLRPEPFAEFRALPGNGVSAQSGQGEVLGGSLAFMRSRTEVPEGIVRRAEALSEEGKTPLLFASPERLMGLIAVADVIKKESPEAVKQLQALGLEVVMLTGDNERTARAIGRQVGVDRVIAGVLPDGKEAVIRDMTPQGRTIMVGDGINDAPALMRADIGVAIGAGADVAVDAASVVLMKSRPDDVPAAVRLSRRTVRNIHENLFWAFFYNIICIPLAAGFYQALFGLNWEMNPMIGAAAMSLSSFCVCMNALRLNLVDPHDTRRDRPMKKAGSRGTDAAESLPRAEEKEENRGETASDNERIDTDTPKEKEIMMTKTMKIEGMMCGHCEAAVKKALEALGGVAEAQVSHETGTAVVTLAGDVSDEVLTKAVEDKDYKVLSVEGE